MKNNNYCLDYTDVSLYVEYAYELFANIYYDPFVKRKMFRKQF